MPLVQVALFGVLRGLAEALGVSASGIEAAARVLLEPARLSPVVEAALAFGAALAIGVAVRRRLVAMFAETVRALARPALFRDAPGGRDAVVLVAALAVGGATHIALRGVFAPWQASPMAAGIGVLLTGFGLASTALARRGTSEAPSLVGALAVGIAYGAAGWPGASRLAAALTMLIWLGVRQQRAAEFALILTCAGLLASAATSASASREGADFAAVAIAVGIAFVSAMAGAALLRSLAIRRRLAALALSTLPLGLALLAYARALPTS